MTMRFDIKLIGMIIAMVAIVNTGHVGFGDEKDPALPKKTSSILTVVRAMVCEDVKNLLPVNPTVVFSVEKEKAFCFAEIEGIVKSDTIYHDWIRRDAHVVGFKQVLKPPRWSTSSSITLRETDKGPWRVEITDMDGNILKILRFSVVD
ncbi:MAG: DUF2914 domain-containing protein [Desulfobacterium sp.]|nr:DUF2914 domain-containing protein [Desulfobacterium sp.]